MPAEGDADCVSTHGMAVIKNRSSDELMRVATFRCLMDHVLYILHVWERLVSCRTLARVWAPGSGPGGGDKCWVGVIGLMSQSHTPTR